MTIMIRLWKLAITVFVLTVLTASTAFPMEYSDSQRFAMAAQRSLRMVLGSQALRAAIGRLEERIADYKTQTELAVSTDIVE